LHTFPICREKSIVRSIEFLKESGLKVFCAAEKSAKNSQDSDLKGPAVLVMGSEDKGISRELISLADNIVSIPMKGNIESLNVSVATGILIYEICRQRSA
jgi:23S rRNA (guanosine2251-2'-O)-methyltransferase